MATTTLGTLNVVTFILWRLLLMDGSLAQTSQDSPEHQQGAGPGPTLAASSIPHPGQGNGASYETGNTFNPGVNGAVVPHAGQSGMNRAVFPQTGQSSVNRVAFPQTWQSGLNRAAFPQTGMSNVNQAVFPHVGQLGVNRAVFPQTGQAGYNRAAFPRGQGAAYGATVLAPSWVAGYNTALFPRTLATGHNAALLSLPGYTPYSSAFLAPLGRGLRAGGHGFYSPARHRFSSAFTYPYPPAAAGLARVPYTGFNPAVNPRFRMSSFDGVFARRGRVR